ncbi:hypothetical protein [Marinilactibacillus psychrotolerans]|uniref:Uncharacterized protein n=1 Tax=Marinilactibacillus psychrotolerans TaxID=191770 RepID=A0A5R9C8E8_9LACT|nr:hypothetical protein [Marinilactibacillus psychrotolerans]TLQ09592.1 hypothetical protein FEZ48_00130 [Marinilactibacillus psychrotolerans]
MNKINVTLFYNDSFPKKYVLSNEDAVDLIKLIKEDVSEFEIKENTYKTEELSSISFSDVDYEGQVQGVAIQFNEQ